MTSWAEPFIGKPYADGGRGPDAFDCWGLVREVLARTTGVHLPYYEYGTNRHSRNTLIDSLRPGFSKIDGPEEFALVLAHTGNRRPHIGICIDAHTMLHAARGIGACLARLESPQWRNAISGFYLPTHRPA